jgi:pimeloyl-ACP methyl ester carboxylesterase
VTCPTLIVAGVDALQRIPRSGHMPTIDDPETVFAAIDAFLGMPAGAAE